MTIEPIRLPDDFGLPEEEPEPERELHPATKSVLRHFRYKHLPPNLQKISKPFCELAYVMANEYPQDPETTVGLRKLLEAKDCAVRANV